ncbi:flagellar protein [Brevibacillus humidisoli]|uniref:TIGR03826 family flagellar region protein n=1 Tax=Brevibacillus humidisoli TaxID=2895522 RepID=UPI001E4A6BC7|nr:TIGR03826 family flagellar region protein [Brevibacillus humidisoli]UFJ40063.1 flagellar protein [Brevibacillus humidisoli]
MSLGNLANCSRCDTLFVKKLRDVCPKCYQEIEQEYDRCAKFLRKRENRGATIYQLSDATDVSVKQITKFIREGRISVLDNPNLGYPCESCGTMIRAGNLCETCGKSLKRLIDQQLEVEKRLEEDRQRAKGIGYRSRKGTDD